jgi:hypothetical protein
MTVHCGTQGKQRDSDAIEGKHDGGAAIGPEVLGDRGEADLVAGGFWSAPRMAYVDPPDDAVSQLARIG